MAALRIESDGDEDAGRLLEKAASGASDLRKADFCRVHWPEGIEEVQLTDFDIPIEGVAWPIGLVRLAFHDLRPDYSTSHVMMGLFNRAFDGATFPSRLREMFLGEGFNQPLGGIVWPQGLERLSLPGYRRSIDDARWPPALKSLEFMLPEQIRLRKAPYVELEDLGRLQIGFNSRFTTLPASLETLWLSDSFEQSPEGVVWPSGLSTLGLGAGFSPYLMSGVSWPSSLRHLFSTYDVDETVSLPQGCTVSVHRMDEIRRAIDPIIFKFDDRT